MRKFDTGWRDSSLAYKHADWGFSFPVDGTVLPMVEYDHGVPLALISYHRRGVPLPGGKPAVAAHRALGSLHRETGEQLPLFSVMYDTRNWAMRILGHNHAATEFLGTTDWVAVTEAWFARMLYRLRGRHAPDLAPYGVSFGTGPWIATEPSPDWPGEAWPGQLMSTRRRNYEPVGPTRMSWRNPCVDIDLAVVDVDDKVALVVDYKAPGAKVSLDSTNMKALASLHTAYHPGSAAGSVASMVAQYEPGPEGWTFRVSCLNLSARSLLAYALGPVDGAESALAHAVATGEGVFLTEDQWTTVLRTARYV